MNRLGIQHTEAVEFIKSLSMEEDIQLDGVYTHFAESENMNIDFTKLQLSRFKAVLGAIKKLNISGFTAHAANSGAIINHPDTYLDAVRPGISLYGYSPNSEISGGLHLKPAMKLISAVDSVKTIQPGDTVSYGRLFIAETPTNIASIPIGYADGLPRILTNQMKVLINGKSYPQIGRVTMDRIMAAIGNDSICIGDQVVLLGEQGELTIDAWEWSKAIETIPYEITCSFYNFRVPRIYFS
jgi:alanine racemase